ncbi:hypothetical protein ACFQH3_01830 [Haladaptatus sp. GCM10025707]|uniref:hypothetical protein n=1 Tax=unclassified Haladaptatus TaxID=2622732 RepID=UPI0023E85B1B|nr:hypothetical protein [Haladaptatus sp. QDMS2]
MPAPPTRRRLLSACVGALSAALGGCAGAFQESDSTPETSTPTPVPVPTDELTETPEPTTETPEPTNEFYRSIKIRLHEITDEQLGMMATTRLTTVGPETTALLSRIIDNGPFTETTLRGPLVRKRVFVSRDETGYMVTATEQARTQVTGYSFTLDSVTTCGRDDQWDDWPGKADAVAFENLPEVDQQLFTRLGRGRLEEQSCLSSGFVHVFDSAAEADQSQFTGAERTTVEYDGEYYWVDFRGTRPIDEVSYRYAAEELPAYSSAALGHAVEPYVVSYVDPDALPEPEREIYTDLIANNHYEATNPIPDAVGELRSRLTAKGRWGTPPYAFFSPDEETFYSVHLTETVS